MPSYIVNGMRVHMKGRKLPPPCRAIVERQGFKCHCQGFGGILCDFPVGDSTCDMPLCTEHGVEVGKDRHFCPKHKAESDAAAPGLFDHA